MYILSIIHIIYYIILFLYCFINNNRLSEQIQTLVRQTGPLGTCMDFIQEDLDHNTMTLELRKWEDEGKRLVSYLLCYI